MKGELIYDMQTKRLDILGEDGSHWGGLHCGNVIEVYNGEEWVSTRVEYSSDWYLVGMYGVDEIPFGLQVRI